MTTDQSQNSAQPRHNRLVGNISSDYIDAANRLRGKSHRQRIVAYVESYDDVLFWRSVLGRFENEQRYFEIMLPTRGNKLERGKKAAMMSALSGNTGHAMIACVDADYDYLEQGLTDTSRQMLSARGVFHTYAYAIENMQCYASSLHDLCVSATLNDQKIFDFEAFLSNFSTIVYPLFVWSIWAYRGSAFKHFSISDFNHVADLPKFQLSDWEGVLQKLQTKVDRTVKSLHHSYPNAIASVKRLSAELQGLGVKPETTYLYIQGHHLFDRIVLPLLRRVCSILVHQRQKEISSESVNYSQRQGELSCYSRSVTDVELMLKKNRGFVESPEYGRIVADVAAFFTDKTVDA